MYEKNEKLCMHNISQMEKVIPFFQYEPLVLTPYQNPFMRKKREDKLIM
jgi:hypothetical protein